VAVDRLREAAEADPASREPLHSLARVYDRPATGKSMSVPSAGASRSPSGASASICSWRLATPSSRS
jgi:hypothetical protein